MEASKFFVGGGYFGSGIEYSSPEIQKPTEHFTIDDLLDFSNDQVLVNDGFFDNVTGNSTDSSSLTVVDSCNSSISGSQNQLSGNVSQFNGDLSVPYDDLVELEWLSNFVDDSFSTENELKNIHIITGTKPRTPESSSSERTPATATVRSAPIFKQRTALPGKARSKRSRATPCDWSTRLQHLSSPPLPKADVTKNATPKKRENNSNAEYSGRKCLHCASEKTPQWRTGPMGPKTLCNACGVRYKSGRLVPEYRPASSPTFISARHSNSHRKVLELRRQKELQTSQHPQFISQSAIFGLTDGGDDYLIHHSNGHMM